MFFRKPSDHVPHVTIFHTILRSMLWILFIEIALLVGISLSLPHQHESLSRMLSTSCRYRRKTAKTICKARCSTRRTSRRLRARSTAVTQAMLDDGEISLDTLDTAATPHPPCCSRSATALIPRLRHRPVTGIFVVLNTHDLDTREKGEPLPCLYLRDLDPNSSPSQRNSDLMLVARTRTGRTVTLHCDRHELDTLDQLRSQRQQRLSLSCLSGSLTTETASWNAADYGHWTSSPYTLCRRRSLRHRLHTIPLILDDGTVYGRARRRSS